VWDRGARTVAAALDALPTVTSLDLSSNDIGPAGAVAIAAAVRASRHLQALALDGNPVGNAGCRAIAAAIMDGRAPALARLGLASTFVRVQGAVAIGAAMRCNPPLRSLDLSGNSIGPSGGESIGAGLAEACSMRELKLSGCMLRNQGASAVCIGAAQSPQLEVLDLRDNFLSDGCMPSAGHLLGASGTLRILKLGEQALGSGSGSGSEVGRRRESAEQEISEGEFDGGGDFDDAKRRTNSGAHRPYPSSSSSSGTGRKIEAALEASGTSRFLLANRSSVLQGGTSVGLLSGLPGGAGGGGGGGGGFSASGMHALLGGRGNASGIRAAHMSKAARVGTVTGTGTGTGTGTEGVDRVGLSLSLRSLDLSRCKIDDRAAVFLLGALHGGALPSIRKLDLSDNPGCGDGAAASLLLLLGLEASTATTSKAPTISSGSDTGVEKQN